jgi:hypothetical protein
MQSETDQPLNQDYNIACYFVCSWTREGVRMQHNKSDYIFIAIYAFLPSPLWWSIRLVISRGPVMRSWKKTPELVCNTAQYVCVSIKNQIGPRLIRKWTALHFDIDVIPVENSMIITVYVSQDSVPGSISLEICLATVLRFLTRPIWLVGLVNFHSPWADKHRTTWICAQTSEQYFSSERLSGVWGISTW